MSKLFRDRIASAALEKNSRTVLALDPPTDADVLRFADSIIDKVQHYICAIKINFHLILPLSGSDIAKINDVAHSHGLQSIADLKLNDVESTNDVAVDLLTGKMGFDAVIANPFIGTAALESLVRKARTAGAGVIALVYMSHPGANEGFGLEIGQSQLYQVFLERASRAGADGIVVGATSLGILQQVAKENPLMPVYSPGIGAQGGDLEQAFRSGATYLIIGRSIIGAKDQSRAAKEIQDRISAVVRK